MAVRSQGGLSAAAALAKHAKRVTIVETDALPARVSYLDEPRAGTPQVAHGERSIAHPRAMAGQRCSAARARARHNRLDT